MAAEQGGMREPWEQTGMRPPALATEKGGVWVPRARRAAQLANWRKKAAGGVFGMESSAKRAPPPRMSRNTRTNVPQPHHQNKKDLWDQKRGNRRVASGQEQGGRGGNLKARESQTGRELIKPPGERERLRGRLLCELLAAASTPKPVILLWSRELRVSEAHGPSVHGCPTWSNRWDVTFSVSLVRQLVKPTFFHPLVMGKGRSLSTDNLLVN